MPKRWWESDPRERFWLEITARTDLGVDLNAPQLQDDGKEFWGYSLLKEIRDGEIVFHYQKQNSAIVAWSRTSGEHWEDEVVWGARGTAARTAGVVPYKRPGWRLGLENFSHLSEPVSEEEMRASESLMRTIRTALQSRYGDPLYMPFAFSDRRPLRMNETYMAKLPADVVEAFPSLQEAAALAIATRSLPAVPAPAPSTALDLGADADEADEKAAVSDRDPFTIDPTLVERGLRGHAITQNRLRGFILARGLRPKKPKPGEPEYDLAWVVDGTIYVAEVKSITNANQEKQLRLGLGQVLRYRHLLAQNGATVRAVLVAEKEPADPTWIELCSTHDVILVWPDSMKAMF
jgi:hypothetical protein